MQLCFIPSLPVLLPPFISTIYLFFHSSKPYTFLEKKLVSLFLGFSLLIPLKILLTSITSIIKKQNDENKRLLGNCLQGSHNRPFLINFGSRVCFLCMNFKAPEDILNLASSQETP